MRGLWAQAPTFKIESPKHRRAPDSSSPEASPHFPAPAMLLMLAVVDLLKQDSRRTWDIVADIAITFAFAFVTNLVSTSYAGKVCYPMTAPVHRSKREPCSRRSLDIFICFSCKSYQESSRIPPSSSPRSRQHPRLAFESPPPLFLRNFGIDSEA